MKSILIVDDSLTVRMDVKELVEEAGYPAATASTLAEARDAFSDEVGLIVLDVQLPDGDGVDFMIEVRRSSDVPIVMLSTEADVRDRVRGLTHGASAYVGKPYAHDTLLSHVRALTHATAPRAMMTIVVLDRGGVAVASSLAHEGYEVLLTTSAEEALMTARASPTDAIVVVSASDGEEIMSVLGSDTILAEIPRFRVVDAQAALAELGRIFGASRAPKSKTKQTRVLAVDDSVTYRHELVEALNDWGMDVTACADGSEALVVTEDDSFDAILVDMVMPGLSGSELCERIRAKPHLRATPIIMLTARSDSRAVIEAMNAGADDFVSKSSGLQVLRARLRAQLRRRRVEEETRRVHAESQRRQMEARAARELVAAKAALFEQLEQSERRFRLLADHSTDLVSTLDLDGRFTYASPAAERLLGAQGEELVGVSIFDICVEQDRAEIESEWARLRSGQHIRVRYRVHVAGTSRWLEMNAHAFEQDGVRLVLATSRDVTSRAAIEARLEAAVALADAILESVPDAIIATDQQGTIHTFNPAAVQLFGYERDNVLGKNVSILAGTTDWLSDELGTMRELAAVHRMGHAIPVDLRVGRTELDDDVLHTAVVRDISERIRMTSELRHAREEAERANSAKSAFLAHMSHEIRTPLNAILGFSEMMSRDPDLAPHLRGYVDTINRSGEHLLALINDILTISKIEAGRVELKVERFDLATLVGHLESLFRVRAHERSLELVVEHDELPRNVLGDASRVRQVLLNLIGNAVKFTERGFVRLFAKCIPTDEGFSFHVTIEDSGLGMSAREIERIFEPFTQTTAGHVHGGTGLGLSITKRSLELMGGTLAVESELGKGTTFDVVIPLRHAAGEDVARRAHVNGLVPGEHVRVLVADDTPSNLDLLRAMLESAGFEFHQVEDGGAALQAIDQLEPDIVLLDVQMPVLNGEEVIRRVRASEGPEERLPIIVVTASAFEEDRQRLLAVGADGFVRKPFNSQQIMMAIGDVLGCAYEEEGTDVPGIEEPSMLELSPELARTLREALELADHARLEEIVDAIDLHPSVVGRLRRQISSYDYDAVAELLDGSKLSGSSKE